MSTQSGNDNTQQESQAPAENQPTLEEQLAATEQRRKDTQSAYTKGQQTNKSLEAENIELKKQLEANTRVTLSPEVQEELEDLKITDPDAWRQKLNQLETTAKGEARANFDNLTGEAKKAAEFKFELERRQTVLNEFNESAEVAITNELITNEVPPRITKKLEEGVITWEDFLTEVSEYVATGKVVKKEETLEQPNLGKAAGGTKPSDTKPEKGLSESYKDDVY